MGSGYGDGCYQDGYGDGGGGGFGGFGGLIDPPMTLTDYGLISDTPATTFIDYGTLL